MTGPDLAQQSGHEVFYCRPTWLSAYVCTNVVFSSNNNGGGMIELPARLGKSWLKRSGVLAILVTRTDDGASVTKVSILAFCANTVST